MSFARRSRLSALQVTLFYIPVAIASLLSVGL
jgi:hypothetical protein